MIGIDGGPRESLTSALLRNREEGESPDPGPPSDTYAQEVRKILVTAGLKPPGGKDGGEGRKSAGEHSQAGETGHTGDSKPFTQISPRLRSMAQLDARARLRAELQEKTAGLRAAQAARVAQLAARLKVNENLPRASAVTDKTPALTARLREIESLGREEGYARCERAEGYADRVRAQVREGIAAEEAKLAAEREGARLLEEARLRHAAEKEALEKAAQEQIRATRERELALRGAMFERAQQRLALMRCLSLWRARCKTYEAMSCVAQKLCRKHGMEKVWGALKEELARRRRERQEAAARLREEERALALRRAELSYACGLARRAFLALLAVRRVRAASAAAQAARSMRLSRIDALCTSLEGVGRGPDAAEDPGKDGQSGAEGGREERGERDEGKGVCTGAGANAGAGESAAVPLNPGEGSSAERARAAAPAQGDSQETKGRQLSSQTAPSDPPSVAVSGATSNESAERAGTLEAPSKRTSLELPQRQDAMRNGVPAKLAASAVPAAPAVSAAPAASTTPPGDLGPQNTRPKPYKPPPVNKRQQELEERINRRKQQRIESLEAAKREKAEIAAREAERAAKLRAQLREAARWRSARTVRAVFNIMVLKHAAYASYAARAESFRKNALIRISFQRLCRALRENVVRVYGGIAELEERERRIGLVSDRITMSLSLKLWVEFSAIQRENRRKADMVVQRRALKSLSEALRLREEVEAARGRELRRPVLCRAAIRTWRENARAQKMEGEALSRRKKLVSYVLERNSSDWEERLEQKFADIFESFYSQSLPRTRSWNEVLALAGISSQIPSERAALPAEVAPLSISDLAY